MTEFIKLANDFLQPLQITPDGIRHRRHNRLNLGLKLAVKLQVQPSPLEIPKSQHLLLPTELAVSGTLLAFTLIWAAGSLRGSPS